MPELSLGLRRASAVTNSGRSEWVDGKLRAVEMVAYSIGHPVTCSKTRGSRFSPTCPSARSAFPRRTARCRCSSTLSGGRNIETRSTCARASTGKRRVCTVNLLPRAPEVICHLYRRSLFFSVIPTVIFVSVFVFLAWEKRKAEVACFAGAFDTVFRRKGRGAPRRAAFDFRVTVVDWIALPVLFARSASRTLRVVAVAIAPLQASLLAPRRAGTVCTGLVLEAC